MRRHRGARALNDSIGASPLTEVTPRTIESYSSTEGLIKMG